MSVIAWDGYQLVADKQASNNGRIEVATKLIQLHDGRFGMATYAGWVGTHSHGLALAKWFAEGADPAKWPSFQTRENWTRLIIGVYGKGVWVYEDIPERDFVESPYLAWGSGGDFAMGAMANGASAATAVTIANQLSDTCGQGLTVVTLKERA